MEQRRHFEEVYCTETAEDLSPARWLSYGEDKLGHHGTDIKLVGVRNYWPTTKGDKTWQRPGPFCYGTKSKANKEQAYHNGFIELRFSYKPLATAYGRAI